MNAKTTMQQMRAWTGPALFSYGFRPFFLLAALQASIVIGVFLLWYFAALALPSLFTPTAWHAHSLLFGFVPAVVAGFLLTAVPNWTGRLPVVGWPLVALAGLWLVGRLAVLCSAWLGPLPTALLDLAFLVALLVAITREIVAGRNWRNLKLPVVVLLMIVAGALFHADHARYGRAEAAERLALAATVFLIMLIGGRIIPSFTTNWLKARHAVRLPVPHNRFDQFCMVAAAVALLGWVGLAWHARGSQPPASPSWATAGVGGLMLLCAALHLARLARWRGGPLTWREPLVAVLHLAYAFVPLGLGLTGASLVLQDGPVASAGLHAWTAGAIGLMTLAVMTRASLGHTGHALTARAGTVVIYGLALLAALLRITVALQPRFTVLGLPLAALCWSAAFGLFAVLYGPMLSRPRTDADAVSK